MSRRKQMLEALDQDIRDHIETETQDNIDRGMSPKEACLDALKRVARNFDNDKTRLAPIDINFYALRKDGEYAGASLFDGSVSNGKMSRAQFAVNDGGPSRLEPTQVDRDQLELAK